MNITPAGPEFDALITLSDRVKKLEAKGEPDAIGNERAKCAMAIMDSAACAIRGALNTPHVGYVAGAVSWACYSALVDMWAEPGDEDEEDGGDD